MTDASFGVHPDGKRHTRVCIPIGGGFFYDSSTKQKIVTTSSTEAELVGVAGGASQVIWVRDFLLAPGLEIGPAIVWQNNKSTLAIMQKGRSTSSHTTHISIKYFFIIDRIQSVDVILKCKPTEHMVANLPTKPIQEALLRCLRRLMLSLNV